MHAFFETMIYFFQCHSIQYVEYRRKYSPTGLGVHRWAPRGKLANAAMHREMRGKAFCHTHACKRCSTSTE
jgi:hypothetical protein